MQERHKDRKAYFDEQILTTQKYVIPYVEPYIKIDASTRVLEVGCGEGGNLVPFLELGCECIGIDLNKEQIANARIFISEKLEKYNLELITEDMYNIDQTKIGKFDFIFLRDVIEHIHNQEKFLAFIKVFLKPNGKMFFGFPPWTMPFGGHQQTCKSKWLSKLPYFHLLPMKLYTYILSMAGESKNTIEELVEVKETGISTSRFEKIMIKEGYIFDVKTKYLINPNYQTKFGLKPRVLPRLLWSIPFINDKITTCYYCLVSLPK